MKKGFTLAEVLITLGVIGVIAALTLPNIIGNYQNKVLMTQLQKTYNLVKTAVVTSLEKEGAENFTTIISSNPDVNVEFLQDYFDTAAVCTKTSTGGFEKCLAPSYKDFSKTNTATAIAIIKSVSASDTAACAALTSGATVCVYGDANFLIDVNGAAEPNIVGRDLFWFRVRDNKIVLSTQNKGSSTYDRENDLKQLRGENCTQAGAGINPKATTCLPAIISGGWKFPF